MIKVLNSNQSIELDKLSIKNKIISEAQLIDNAGKAVAYHIIENFDQPFSKKYLCVAGIGKNGLDAIVCNYYLNLNNINSKLLIINKDNIDFRAISKYIDKKNIFNDVDIKNLSTFDWVVDGIFGTGLNRKIEGDYYKVIKSLKMINNILSIDIPSGIFADNGDASNIFIKAKQTISFTYPKIGHLFSLGYAATGELFLYPIGHSDEDVNSNLKLIDKDDILDMMQPVDISKHKYSRGKILSLSGSKSYTGAALLSGKAGIQSGAGVVKQIIPSSLHYIMSRNNEAIDLLLNDNQDGFLSLDSYKEIKIYFDWADCFIVGPGLSQSEKSINLVKKILKEYKGNCVLDASGFLSLPNYSDNIFSKIPGKTILTPHYGELAKILNISNEELNRNTIKILSDISKKLDDRVLVLKGPNTIITNGNNQIYIISNGNQLLSTAGSGDVLTGIISFYVSSGYSLEKSAIIGTYVHAECSNFLLNKKYENMCASKIIDLIPKVQSGLRSPS